MELAEWSPPCMATSATPGRWFREIMSPTTNTSGWPGRVRSGSTEMRPARSSSAPVASASIVPSGDACTPAAQMTVWEATCDGLTFPDSSLTVDVDAGAVDRGHPRPHHQLHAHALERPRRLHRKLVAERGQRLGAPVHQHDPHLGRVDAAEVALQAADRHLPDLAGQLDAGRAGADDHHRHPRVPLRRVRRRSRPSPAPRAPAAGSPARRRSSSSRARTGRTRRGRSTTGRRRRRRSGCRRGSPSASGRTAWCGRPGPPGRTR